MKKIIILSLLVLTCVARADDNGADARIKMLDSEIVRLTAERDEKYAALEQCAKTTKGFKIAGISTLVATGFGVYGNIKLAQKINNGGSSSGGSHTIGDDNRSETQKANDECAMFCGLDPDTAREYHCDC